MIESLPFMVINEIRDQFIQPILNSFFMTDFFFSFRPSFLLISSLSDFLLLPQCSSGLIIPQLSYLQLPSLFITLAIPLFYALVNSMSYMLQKYFYFELQNTSRRIRLRFPPSPSQHMLKSPVIQISPKFFSLVSKDLALFLSIWECIILHLGILFLPSTYAVS